MSFHLPAPLRFPVAVAAAVFLLAPVPGGSAPDDDSPALARGTVAFVDVRVVPMDAERIVPHRTVVVRDGRIAAIGPVDEIAVPEGATVVEGRGRYLLPGLADMHVHLRRDDLAAYVAHGITTVRNMWGHPEIVEMMDDVASVWTESPAIHTLSPGLDGRPPKWPHTRLVEWPAAADEAVEAQQRAGYTTLKIYQDLRRPVYDAIVEAAGDRGMAFAGHVPTRVGLTRALEAGQHSIEHLSGFAPALDPRGRRGAAAWANADLDLLPPLVESVREAGTWICPTLAIQLRLQQSHPVEVRSAAARNRARVVRALHEAGVPLLVGTDSGIDVVSPGTSLVEELGAFVDAGLSPYEALRIATVDAAEHLGLEDEIGTLAVGRRADLVLVASNPLDDVATLIRPDGVVLRGRWLPAR